MLFAQNSRLNSLAVADWQTASTGWETAQSVFIQPFKKDVKITKGNAILLAQNGANKITYPMAFTDIKIKFDFMLNQDGEAVFYLMDKYGIVLNNAFVDSKKLCGRIRKTDGSYQNPQQDACKATGLWQTLELTFANKTANNPATLEKVSLNGITLHENYFFTESAENNTPTNGFGFQYGSGLIAIRNIEYALLGNEKPIKINDLNYEVQETEGWGKTFEPKNTPIIKGTTKQLSPELEHPFEHFIAKISGKMLVEKPASYQFTLDYLGVAQLSIDGKHVAGSKEYIYRIPQTGNVELSTGEHTFTYQYQRIWWQPAFGLFVSSQDIRPYALHSANALPAPETVGEVAVQPSNKVEILRSFLMFNAKKRTHTVSVGSPQKVHYSFDLNQGTPLYYWRGNFADVTEMWYERGEPQLLKPQGLLLQLSGKPNVFYLKDIQTASPNSTDDFKEMIFKSYRLDTQGNPTYLFELNGTKISQTFTPNNQGIKHRIETDNQQLLAKLGEAKQIQKIDKNLYLLDNYYIQLTANTNVIVRNTKEGQEILAPLQEILEYRIFW